MDLPKRATLIVLAMKARDRSLLKARDLATTADAKTQISFTTSFRLSPSLPPSCPPSCTPNSAIPPSVNFWEFATVDFCNLLHLAFGTVRETPAKDLYKFFRIQTRQYGGKHAPQGTTAVGVGGQSGARATP